MAGTEHCAGYGHSARCSRQLYEHDQVFAVIGNVGTPTAVVSLPYALDRKMLFFGAFTGAGLLRNDPPDRYVFNYRASYAEETAVVVNYLVRVKHLTPQQLPSLPSRTRMETRALLALRRLSGHCMMATTAQFCDSIISATQSMLTMLLHNCGNRDGSR